MACASGAFTRGPNYQGKRRRSTAGAQGTNTGHEDGEAMASVGVRLTAQLGHGLCKQLDVIAQAIDDHRDTQAPAPEILVQRSLVLLELLATVHRQ